MHGTVTRLLNRTVKLTEPFDRATDRVFISCGVRIIIDAFIPTIRLVMPNAAAVSFRRLARADAEAFRDIRLEGLQHYPASFGAAYDDERTQPLEWFGARIADHAVFGGFSGDGVLMGVAGLLVPTGAKMKHKGVLWGMYVRANARGTGLAAALLDCVITHARNVVDEIKLEVAPDNLAALGLYRAAGFVEYAREPRALRIDGIDHDSLFMMLQFERRA